VKSFAPQQPRREASARAFLTGIARNPEAVIAAVHTTENG
jgi:hypothetical protein